MIQFLIDECLSPALVEVAHRFGYVAYHVQYRNWKSKEDSELLRHAREEGLALVTNNWRDFGPMLGREMIHAGAIVIPNVPRAEQVAAMERSLRAIQAAHPPLDMVNTVIEVLDTGEVQIYELP